MVGVAKLGGDVSQFSVLSVTAVDSGPAECQLQAECIGAGAGFYLNISQAPRLAAGCRVINNNRNNIRLRLTAIVCQVYTILHHLHKSGCY